VVWWFQKVVWWFSLEINVSGGFLVWWFQNLMIYTGLNPKKMFILWVESLRQKAQPKENFPTQRKFSQPTEKIQKFANPKKKHLF